MTDGSDWALTNDIHPITGTRMIVRMADSRRRAGTARHASFIIVTSHLLRRTLPAARERIFDFPTKPAGGPTKPR
jgi:hypothetical protein